MPDREKHISCKAHRLQFRDRRSTDTSRDSAPGIPPSAIRAQWQDPPTGRPVATFIPTVHARKYQPQNPTARPRRCTKFSLALLRESRPDTHINPVNLALRHPLGHRPFLTVMGNRFAHVGRRLQSIVSATTNLLYCNVRHLSDSTTQFSTHYSSTCIQFRLELHKKDIATITSRPGRYERVHISS